jgi:hypothetical protein
MPTGWIRDRLTSELTKGLDRPVELETLRFSFWGGVSLVLKGIEVGNASGFQAPHFLKVGSVRVGLAVAPLLRKMVEVTRLEVRNVEAHIERREDGQTNIPAGGGEGAAIASSLPPIFELPSGRFSETWGIWLTAPASTAFEFKAERIELKDLSVSYDDRMAGQRISVKGIDLDLDVNRLAIPSGQITPQALLAGLDLSGELRVSEISAPGVALAGGRVPFRAASGAVALTGLSLPVNDGSIGGELHCSWPDEHPRFKTDLKFSGISLTDGLKEHYLSRYMPATYHLFGGAVGGFLKCEGRGTRQQGEQGLSDLLGALAGAGELSVGEFRLGDHALFQRFVQREWPNVLRPLLAVQAPKYKDLLENLFADLGEVGLVCSFQAEGAKVPARLLVRLHDGTLAFLARVIPQDLSYACYLTDEGLEGSGEVYDFCRRLVQKEDLLIVRGTIGGEAEFNSLDIATRVISTIAGGDLDIKEQAKEAAKGKVEEEVKKQVGKELGKQLGKWLGK